MKCPTVHFRNHTPSDNEGSDWSDASSLTSLPSDMDEDDPEYGKIPKPSGESGRPNRGGYTLRLALKWSAKDYKALKVWSGNFPYS